MNVRLERLGALTGGNLKVTDDRPRAEGYLDVGSSSAVK